MLLHELIVGEILIERADDVVAVAPGFLLLEIELMAAGFRETHQIEPVPGPALAIMRRGQQPVDHSFISLWGIVSQEGRDFLRRRRQTREIEGHAAQQCGLVGRRRRGEAIRFHLGEKEAVNRRARPGPVLHHRRRGVADRLKSPKFPSLGEIDFAWVRRLTRWRCARIRRAHADPLREVGYFGGAEPSSGRHFQLRIAE